MSNRFSKAVYAHLISDTVQLFNFHRLDIACIQYPQLDLYARIYYLLNTNAKLIMDNKLAPLPIWETNSTPICRICMR